MSPVSDGHSGTWEEWFSDLVDHFDRGEPQLSQFSPDPKVRGLWIWAQEQRRAHRRGTLAVELIDRLDDLDGWSWGPVEAKWDTTLERVQRHRATAGYWPGAMSSDPAEAYLGRWLGDQIGAHNAGTLRHRRRRRLEQIEGWTWSAVEMKWDATLRRVLDHRASSGGWPSAASLDPDEAYLGRWLGVQVSDHRAGRLREERRVRLEQIEGWSWNAAGRRWGLRLVEIHAWVARHGHWPNDGSSDPVERGHAIWIQKQQSAGRKGTLSPEHMALLAATPGWVWSPVEERWRQRLNEQARWSVKHGRQPTRYSTDPVERAHGIWIQKQRVAARNGTLSDERRQALTATPGWVWDHDQVLWDQHRREMMSWVATERRWPSPHAPGQEGVLGRWRAAQRVAHAGMRPDRVAALEAIPGWRWNGRRALSVLDWLALVAQVRAAEGREEGAPHLKGLVPTPPTVDP